jgi:hypothetical protein
MQINKLYKPVLLALSLVLIAMNLFSWSISDAYLGNNVPAFGTRNFSMGNTGVFDMNSPLSMVLNPANISLLESRTGFEGMYLMTRNEDNRSFPLYNSFDAYLDDATYSSNINLFHNIGFGVSDNWRFGNFVTGMGVSYTPVQSFDAYYQEQVRNNRNSDNDTYPEIIANNRIEGDGSLNALGISWAGGIILPLDLQAHIGVSYNIINGKSDFEKSIRWTDWSIEQSVNHPSLNANVLPDSVFSTTSEMQGNQIKIGGNIQVNNRLGIGMSYSTKSEFDRDTDASLWYAPYGDTTAAWVLGSVKDTYILPSRIRFGFNYQPRNIMRTHFNAEVEYVSWTDVNEQFENSWDLHVGVEHSVTNRIPLRVGFQSTTEWISLPNYSVLVNDLPALSSSKVITPAVTAGSSVQLAKNVVLDFGLSFSWREYQALDMFGDKYYDDTIYTHLGSTNYILWPNYHIALVNRGWENPDKVRESFMQLGTGLTWTW